MCDTCCSDVHTISMGGQVDKRLKLSPRCGDTTSQSSGLQDSPDGTPAGNAASSSKSEEVKKDDKDASKQAVKEEEEEDEDMHGNPAICVNLL